MENTELEKAYRLFSAELVLYAKSLCHDQQQAEHLVSDAFFKLALQEVQPPALKFWLFRVVKNQFLDQQRRKKRWRWQPFEEQQLISPIRPDTELIQTEEQQVLYHGIKQLPEPYQEVIILFYFLHWPTKEIAAFLHLKDPQVRTLLSRGRKKLKEVLTDGKLGGTRGKNQK